MKINKNLKSRNAITLVALIITVIVMLILVGVTVSVVINSDLIGVAQNAGQKTQNAYKTESSYIDDILVDVQDGEVEQVTDTAPGNLEGEGTEASPYTINSIEDLVVFSYNVRNGNTYEGEYVQLGATLNFKSTKSYVNAKRTDYGKYGYDGELQTLLTSGEGFIPIGTTSNVDYEPYTFAGNFNGNNKEIINLYINREQVQGEEIRIGLFAQNMGVIENLGLVKGEITLTINSSTGDVGGIAGVGFYGTIRNSYYIGNINIIAEETTTGLARVGGIQSAGDGSNIENCYHNGILNVKNNSVNSSTYVGGICVSNYKNGSVIGCYSAGNINVDTVGTSFCRRNY